MHDTPVSAIALADAPVAHPDTDIETLRELFRHWGWHIPVAVVDADGTLLGLVRPGDVEAEGAYREPGEVDRGRTPMIVDHTTPPRRAADVMMALVFYLPSDASVARTVALLVDEGVTYAPLVSAQGRYAGMIDGLALLRWLARTCGYVVPEPQSDSGSVRRTPRSPPSES